MKRKILMFLAVFAVMAAMTGIAVADLGLESDPAEITVTIADTGTQLVTVTAPGGVTSLTITGVYYNGAGPAYDIGTKFTTKIDGVETTTYGPVAKFTNPDIKTFTVTYAHDKGAPDGDYTIEYLATYVGGPPLLTILTLSVEADIIAISGISGSSGSISGMKFNDLNGNGVNDAEPGLDGWTITLTGGNGTMTTTTAANGSYSFTGLAAGTYTVTETLQTGWIQTMPSTGTYTVTIISGDVITGQDFGNFQPGEVYGMKFNDLNGNGVNDAESGLGGWTITLTGLTGTLNTTTAVDGSYSFTGLAAGNYTVAETSQAGWNQTMPSTGTYTVTIKSGDVITGQDFGNFQPGKISGMKFLDLNGNGIKDAVEPGHKSCGEHEDDGEHAYTEKCADEGEHADDGKCADDPSSEMGENEPGLAGWVIKLMKPDGSVITTMVTDANGNYSFTNLAPGTYVVGETMQTGWEQTYPMPAGTHEVVIVSGSEVIGKDFGNRKLVTSKVTRTQGFWATHYNFSNATWQNIPAADRIIGTKNLGDMKTVGITSCGPNNVTCDAAELMGGFWSGVAKKTDNTKRSSLDQARMILAQQLLAAMLNKQAFGTSDGGLIAQGKAAFNGTERKDILNKAAALAAFNSGGDDYPIPSVGAANPKLAQAMANKKFWDSLP